MLSPLDWVILGVIAISAVTSILRGFVKEASSIISWVVAFAVTSKCYPMVEPYLTFSNDQLTRNVVACIALFVISLVLVAIASFKTSYDFCPSILLVILILAIVLLVQHNLMNFTDEWYCHEDKSTVFSEPPFKLCDIR